MQLSDEKQERRDKLLESLSFPNMNARKNGITTAQPKTFEWLLSQNDLNSDGASDYKDEKTCVHLSLQDWLKHDNGTFWISGKPGSGKSTLSYFITAHTSTRDLLKQWSGLRDLVLIECYLWNAGTLDRRTFHGLLATLLLQVLRKLTHVPDSMLAQDPEICSKSTLTDWSVQELEQWLLRCLKHKEYYFCIFIDGLDEAEIEPGLPEDSILRFVEKFSVLSGVKCCVSSRPLRKFEIAFGGCQQLRLQELNENDILKYFDDNVRPMFRNTDIDANDHVFKQIRWKFCARAGGVFLWACLAVSSLKRGIENHDSIDQLHERLEALAPELEDLYAQMWTRQNRDRGLYKKEASLYFNVCLAYEETNNIPALLDLVLLQHCDRHSGNDVIMGRATQHLEQECDTIQTRVLTRCAGLLVCQTDPHRTLSNPCMSVESFPALHASFSSEVIFVHRTAKEFLLTSILGKTICAYSKIPRTDLQQRILRVVFRRVVIESPSPKPLQLVEFIRSVCKQDVLPPGPNLLEDIDVAFQHRALGFNPRLKNSD